MGAVRTPFDPANLKLPHFILFMHEHSRHDDTRLLFSITGTFSIGATRTDDESPLSNGKQVAIPDVDSLGGLSGDDYDANHSSRTNSLSNSLSSP
jgi:hypothetical protein